MEKKSINQWFHKWTSPRWFYHLSSHFLPWFATLAAIFITVGVVWGLLFAPEDYQQGNSFRIFYVHLPAAILAQSVFLAMAISAAVLLIWRIKLADVFIKSVALFGALMTFLALFSGAVWGKPTWGTWWEWDGRMTSTLIQFFLYCAVISLYSSIENRQAAGRAAALICIVGVVNIPIIKFSVNWWHSLHQPATFTLTEKPAMPPDMYLPFIFVLLGFYCLFAAVALYRMQTEIIVRESTSQWLKQRFLGANSD